MSPNAEISFNQHSPTIYRKEREKEKTNAPPHEEIVNSYSYSQCSLNQFNLPYMYTSISMNPFHTLQNDHFIPYMLKHFPSQGKRNGLWEPTPSQSCLKVIPIPRIYKSCHQFEADMNLLRATIFGFHSLSPLIPIIVVIYLVVRYININADDSGFESHFT